MMSYMFFLRKRLPYLIIAVAILTGSNFNLLFAQIDLSDFEKTESGLYYKFHIKDESGKKAQSGDMITLDIVHKSENDSIYYSSGDYSYPYSVSMMKSKHNADFYEALEMMAEGDSATFVFDSEVYYKNTFGTTELPPHITKGSKMLFEIRIVDFKTRSEMAYEQLKMIEGQIMDEAKAIEKYIQKNNITTDACSSGLYYVEHNEGAGKKAFEGSLVMVKYKAKLLKSGKVFETTDGNSKELALNQGYIMPGLIEGISKMKEGGKATLIIPSHLGYGPSGSQDVPPNTSLVYEIELVEVYE